MDLPAASVSRLELLQESVAVAQVLRDEMGLSARRRIAVCMLNVPAALAWIEAAKRLGLVYTAVAAGTAASSLATRLSDLTTEAAQAALTEAKAALDTATSDGEKNIAERKYAVAHAMVDAAA